MKKLVQFLWALVLFFFSANLIHAQNIICVDRDGSDTTTYTDDWQFIQPVLDDLGVNYDYHVVLDLANDGPDAATLSNYDIAFYFTGEVWTDGETLTDNDEFALLLYLTVNNGKLILSAQDYLYDKYGGAGTFNPGSFPHDGLGCVEVEQDKCHIEFPDPGPADTANIQGVDGSLAEGVAFTVKDIYTTPSDDGLYIDDFIQHNGQSMLEVAWPDP